MKIAIIGCGAMGSVYAALLADAGNELLVVDRWADHVRAINERGLRLEGHSGDRVVRLRAYAENPPSAWADLVILAVKASHAASAAGQAAAVLAPGGVALTIQNGLGSADVVAEALGGDRLIVGIAAAFGASLKGPGHAHHNGMETVRMGAYGDLPPSQVEAVAQCWREAGFRAEAVDNVRAMQWEKLICNVAYSAPCTLTGLTVGEVMDDELIGPVSRAAATEAWETARALGVSLQVEDPVAHVRAFGARIPAARPSVMLDHEQRRPSEIEFINGAVPREAAKAGREAPVNATLTALVLQRERAFKT